jgi:hypothetical protein
VSKSCVEGLGRRAGSGSWECVDSSGIIPGDNLGVSKSSTAISSLLVLRLGPDPCAQRPETFVRWLYVEEFLELGVGRAGGGGMEMLARSECASVVPGSAYRPFLLDTDLILEAEDSV